MHALVWGNRRQSIVDTILFIPTSVVYTSRRKYSRKHWRQSIVGVRPTPILRADSCPVHLSQEGLATDFVAALIFVMKHKFKLKIMGKDAVARCTSARRGSPQILLLCF